MTVLQHLQYLPEEIRNKAIRNAYNVDKEKYDTNHTYEVNSPKEALKLAFDFALTPEGDKFWYEWLDKTGNHEPLIFKDNYPQQPKQIYETV